MQILRFSSPRIDDGIPLWRSLSLAGDRLTAVMHGRVLRLHDLRSPETPLVAVPDVVAHALSETCLIVQRLSGEVHRFEVRGDGWFPVATLRLPSVPEAESPYWRDMLLSPSGRFLLVDSGPISTGPRIWPVSRVFLVDATSGEPKRAFNLRKTVMRANFAVLPSGDEVLFISADSYMSVQMVDCASGHLLHDYEYQHPSDFCHTDYWLPADASRLFTYGCIWAAPFEVRVYDATPWTGVGIESEGFPLPVTYSQMGEGFVGEHVLPTQPLPTSDGAFSCVAEASLESLPEKGSQEDVWAREDLNRVDLDTYEELQRFPRLGAAIVVRRVDPTSGAVLGWTLSPVQKADSRHIHLLSDHRVLVLNQRIQIVDGTTGEVVDRGPFEPPAEWFSSVVTDDGATLVVHSYEQG